MPKRDVNSDWVAEHLRATGRVVHIECRDHGVFLRHGRSDGPRESERRPVPTPGAAAAAPTPAPDEIVAARSSAFRRLTIWRGVASGRFRRRRAMCRSANGACSSSPVEQRQHLRRLVGLHPTRGAALLRPIPSRYHVVSPARSSRTHRRETTGRGEPSTVSA